LEPTFRDHAQIASVDQNFVFLSIAGFIYIIKTTSATLRVCWHTHQLQVFLEQTPPDSFEVLGVWSLPL